MCLCTDLNYYPVSLTDWAPVLSEECDFNQFMAGWWREVLQTDQSKTYRALWRTWIKREAVVLLILLCFIDLLYGTLPIPLHYLIKKGFYQFAGQLLMQKKKKKRGRNNIYFFESWKIIYCKGSREQIVWWDCLVRLFWLVIFTLLRELIVSVMISEQ